jgi:hypothetical protein
VNPELATQKYNYLPSIASNETIFLNFSNEQVMKSIKRPVILAILFIIPLAFFTRGLITRSKQRKAFEYIKTNVWPKEIAAAKERVKHRQSVNDAASAIRIDLSPYINTALTDSPLAPKGVTGDNLAQLPLGTNLFGGISFNVQGSIQLMGHWFEHYGKEYPIKVENIRIERRCTRIYLLHGAGDVRPELLGSKIAALVLHYSDGSTQDLNIVAGEHLSDWWFPVAESGLPEKFRAPKAPGTELAWIGTNPWIEKWAPGYSLCLYKTTFDNPRPDAMITSLDYVSAMTLATPFLIGLTVE